MEEPTTKPSGSNPASPSSTYSDTDRSEVKTPAGLAPAVFASRPLATCGSHAAAFWFGWLENTGIASLSPGYDHRSVVPGQLAREGGNLRGARDAQIDNAGRGQGG